MKLKLLVILSSVIFAGHSFAGLVVEPYLGAGSVAQKFTVSGLDLADPDTETSSVVGARLGYSFLLLSAGIDYEMQTVDDVNMTNMAAFVGVDFPILVRAWAKYYVSSSFDVDGASDFEFKDGYAVGVGFTGLPFVSLNLELQNLNYSYTKTEATVDYDVDHSLAATVLSVSLPLDL